MPDVTEHDIERIAESVAKKLMYSRAFTIPDEEHYNQHQELKEFLVVVKQGRDVFIKGVSGLVALGALVMVTAGIRSGYWH